MKYPKLLNTAMAAILLGVAAFGSLAQEQSDQVALSAGGVSYVSGGVGTASIDRLDSLAADFNLKLVFALKAGDYVSGVKVTISDAVGKMLLDTTSQGPWLLARLPTGNYQIVASFAGNAERRTVTIGSEKLRTVDFRWASQAPR